MSTTNSPGKLPQTVDGRAAFTIPEFGRLVGRSRAWAFTKLKEGRVPTVVVAGSQMVPASAILAILSTAA
jgi:predicted transcriptional regulator